MTLTTWTLIAWVYIVARVLTNHYGKTKG